MSRIQRLPDHVIDRIAAGEVVERPASVVKELVENAIDADAGQVAVDLGDAGRQLVRVTDDGIGMTAGELELALTRHATSKIRSEADLVAIGTLGFRGEALPAICAVSRFAITSCPRGAAEGTLARGEGGAVAERLGVAATPGTSVEIRDLFFNTPARLKFLKSARSELAATLRLLQAIALARPDIQLRVVHDGRVVLAAPRAADLRDRLGALLGFELAGRMLEARHARDALSVRGLVTPPQIARGSRDEITLIVNGRPVRDALLSQTVLEAYRPLLARDRFPVAVLEIALPLQEVDVNVHPTKAWVRFRAPRLVQEAVFAAVQAALRTDRVVPTTGPAGSGTGPEAPAPGAPGTTATPAAAPPEPGLFREPDAPFARALFGAVVGHLHDTFIVSATEEEVFFVDQHVAHERVLFERLRADLDAGVLPAQELLFPQPVDLGPSAMALLAEWRPTLARLGFDVEEFGGGSLVIKTVPTLLSGDEPRRLLEAFVDDLGSVRGLAAGARARARARVRRLPRRDQGAHAARPSGDDAPARRPGGHRHAVFLPARPAHRVPFVPAGHPAGAPAHVVSHPPLLVIVGPTAVGKTAVAVGLASRAPLEVVSADSRQVYRGLDVGTGKPTAAERAAVPHHLIDIVDPGERYHAARFRADALRAMDGIRRRGRLPAVVGGTGLYVRTLLKGLRPAPPADPALRAALEARAERDGTPALHAELERLAPALARRLHRNDRVRLVRALEVLARGAPPDAAAAPAGEWTGSPPPWNLLMVGLTLPRDILRRRIAERVHAMVACGIMDEVKRLLEAGYDETAPGMDGIGYRQFCAVLRGRLGADEAVAQMIRDTGRYAKRQMTWFARDPEVRWMDVEHAGQAAGVAEALHHRLVQEGLVA
jgi:DNA mismatch repair protein MutL